MVWWPGGYDKVALRDWEVELVEVALARCAWRGNRRLPLVEWTPELLRLSLSGSSPPFERKKDGRERRPHSELDGAVSLYSVSSSCFLFVGGEGCYFSFFILDPETIKNKLISPSFFPLLCRFTRKTRPQNPDMA